MSVAIIPPDRDAASGREASSGREAASGREATSGQPPTSGRSPISDRAAGSDRDEGLRREWLAPFGIDVRLTLSVHRRGAGDPAYRVDATGAVWSSNPRMPKLRTAPR